MTPLSLSAAQGSESHAVIRWFRAMWVEGNGLSHSQHAECIVTNKTQVFRDGRWVAATLTTAAQMEAN